MLELIKE